VKSDEALLGDDILDLHHFAAACQFRVIGRACDDFEQAVARAREERQQREPWELHKVN